MNLLLNVLLATISGIAFYCWFMVLKRPSICECGRSNCTVCEEKRMALEVAKNRRMSHRMANTYCIKFWVE